MISYLVARRARAPWWTDDYCASARHVIANVLPDNYKAKLTGDQWLTAHSHRWRNEVDEKFQGTLLGSGYLINDAATALVELGETKATSSRISRADVAELAVSLLNSVEVRG